jgi:hypothetical protein
MDIFLESLNDSFLATIPLLIIVVILQFILLRLNKKQFIKMIRALFLTFVGLTLFLYGIEIGFSKMGSEIGIALGNLDDKWLVVIIGFILGGVITFAEPAVTILIKQIEEVTFGSISKRLVLIFLAIGVAFAIALSMIRIYFGIPILYFMIPGYILVFILSRFVNPLFLALAIDAGGVVTGPMIASVLLSITVAMSSVIENSNPLLDGFGLVAMVALMPIISIMILGFIYEIKSKGGARNDD